MVNMEIKMNGKKFTIGITLLAICMGFGASFVGNFLWWLIKDFGGYMEGLILTIGLIITIITLIGVITIYNIFKKCK